jgi:hypothetical protein
LLHVKQSTFCPCLQVLTLCPDSPQFRHDHLLTVNRRQKFPIKAINIFTVIMVSGIPPRYGVNVDGLNMMLDELCENLNLQFIDHNHHLYDRNGSVNKIVDLNSHIIHPTSY